MEFGTFFTGRRYLFKGPYGELYESIGVVFLPLADIRVLDQWLHALDNVSSQRILHPNRGNRKHDLETMLITSPNITFSNVDQLKRILPPHTLSDDEVHANVLYAWNHTPFCLNSVDKEHAMQQCIQIPGDYVTRVCTYMYDRIGLNRRIDAARSLYYMSYGTTPLNGRVGKNIFNMIKRLSMFHLHHKAPSYGLAVNLAILAHTQLYRYSERYEFCKWMVLCFYNRIYAVNLRLRDYNPDPVQWGLGGVTNAVKAAYYFNTTPAAWVDPRNRGQKIHLEVDVIRQVIEAVYGVYFGALQRFNRYLLTPEQPICNSETAVVITGGIPALLRHFLSESVLHLLFDVIPSTRSKAVLAIQESMCTWAAALWLVKLDTHERFSTIKGRVGVYRQLQPSANYYLTLY